MAKKEKLIHFPFYCNQYLGIMSELTAKERGFWITLLATYIASDGTFPPLKRLYKRCDVCCENDEKIIQEFLPEIEELGKQILIKQKKLSKKRSEIGKLGGLAKAKQLVSKSKAKGVAKTCHTETDTETELDTEKKKQKKSKKFVPPTQKEVEEYFQEEGYSMESAIRFFKGYDVAEWEDTKGNKIKSWKQKAQQVWFTPDNEVKNKQTSLIDSL